MQQVQLEDTSVLRGEHRLELLLLLHNSTTKTHWGKVCMWSNLSAPGGLVLFLNWIFPFFFFFFAGKNTHVGLDLHFNLVECETIN